MPSGRPRGRAGVGQCASRASASFNEQQVEAMLALFARLDVAPASVRGVGGATLNAVRAKFISMRASIKAAQIAKHALEGQAAQ